MKLLVANVCMMSQGSILCGSVKHTVVSGIFGFTTAVLAVLNVGFLRQRVLDFQHPVAISMLAYFLMGMRRCGCLAHAFCLLISGLLLSIAPLPLLGSIGSGIVSGLCCLGFLYLAMIPCGNLLTIVLQLVAPSVVHCAQEKRIERFIEFLPACDLVCLQELTVFWGMDAYVDFIRQCASACGLVHYAGSGKWPDWPATFAAAGLGVFSRYPILRSEYFSFSRQAWFEWSAIQRGALMVELDGSNGKKIAVMNIHTTAGLEVLEAGVGVAGSSTPNPVGLDQLLEALSRFEVFSSKAHQRILCGDFNLTKDSIAFDCFRKEALRCLKLVDVYPDCPATFACVDKSTGEPLETLLTKKGSQRHPRVIDHVFSDKKCSHAHVDNMAASAEHAKLYGYQQVSDHSALEIVWD
mmetsp:Transcript_92232/g.112937  ORF Transcript_92232/g.112937 Transcript_92232/m.112937 type:complete len:409 (-) Transcript_92232:9-1235(-)